MKIEMMTKKACPICVITGRELDKKNVEVVKYEFDSEDGKRIISESGLKSAPIIKADGKFYAGNDAYKFTKSL